MQSKGNRLAELMEAENPPAQRYEIGALCKRDTTTIGRWINGDVPIPDEAKQMLCTRFGCSVEHLLGWDRNDAKAAA